MRKTVSDNMRKTVFVVFASQLFFGLGVVIAVAARAAMNMENQLLAILVVLPPALLLIAYTIVNRINVSFDLKSLTLNIADQMNKPIEFTPLGLGQIMQATDKAFVLIEKEGPNVIDKMIKDYSLNETTPIIMAIFLGPTTYKYDLDQTRKFVERLAQNQGFRFMIFVEEDLSIMGHVQTKDMIVILNDSAGSGFIDTVNNYHAHSGQQFYDKRFHQDLLYKDRSTDKDALALFAELKVNSLPVVDDKNKLLGVVDQLPLVTRISLATYQSLLDLGKQLEEA